MVVTHNCDTHSIFFLIFAWARVAWALCVDLVAEALTPGLTRLGWPRRNVAWALVAWALIGCLGSCCLGSCRLGS